jgi:hypothetical protein
VACRFTELASLGKLCLEKHYDGEENVVGRASGDGYHEQSHHSGGNP